jgi:hypothetical protein
MPQTASPIPKIAMQSIAGGLLLMAFFTTVWGGIAWGNSKGVISYAIPILFSLCCLLFIGYGIHFFLMAKRFPKLESAEDKAEGKRMGMWYGIIFGLEGILIPAAAGICIYLQHPNLILPAMALVVGLHFYPMAKIFKRTIDYYLATWTCLVAIAAFVIILRGIVTPISVYTLLGVGIALATISYGLQMIKEGKRYIKATF